MKRLAIITAGVFWASSPCHSQEIAPEAGASPGEPLAVLLDSGQIEMEVSGDSIEWVRVKLRKVTGNSSVQVLIVPGTQFKAKDHGEQFQTMVVTSKVEIVLDKTEWVAAKIGVACGNRELKIPGGSQELILFRSAVDGDLERLLPLLSISNVSFSVRQAAIWIVTDNASYDELGTLVFISNLNGNHPTRRIREADAIEAIKLCLDAGIDMENKRICLDLPRLGEGNSIGKDLEELTVSINRRVEEERRIGEIEAARFVEIAESSDGESLRRTAHESFLAFVDVSFNPSIRNTHGASLIGMIEGFCEGRVTPIVKAELPAKEIPGSKSRILYGTGNGYEQKAKALATLMKAFFGLDPEMVSIGEGAKVEIEFIPKFAVPLRTWNLKSGGTFDAMLVDMVKERDGGYLGRFVYPFGGERRLQIGLLTKEDVEVVKQALIIRGEYEAP